MPYINTTAEEYGRTVILKLFVLKPFKYYCGPQRTFTYVGSTHQHLPN